VHPALINIDPTRQPSFTSHRSGWAYALQALQPLHNRTGVLFDSFVERTFCWEEKAERANKRIPYSEAWIGVIHNPPRVPLGPDYRFSLQSILSEHSLQDSLPHCRGLFVLSKYLQTWLVGQVDVPINVVRHPTERPALQFSLERLRENPQRSVIQIGIWLRRLPSIFKLRATGYRKMILSVPIKRFDGELQRQLADMSITNEELHSVERQEFVSNTEYDVLLSRNVVFCDLIDSSANNVIIECLARNTPLLINRLPAVEEYVGASYPLFFDDLEHAAALLADASAVAGAHEYLCDLPKDVLTQESFRNSLASSPIYQSLIR
jgi:hypothetical protein